MIFWFFNLFDISNWESNQIISREIYQSNLKKEKYNFNESLYFSTYHIIHYLKDLEGKKEIETKKFFEKKTGVTIKFINKIYEEFSNLNTEEYTKFIENKNNIIDYFQITENTFSEILKIASICIEKNIQIYDSSLGKKEKKQWKKNKKIILSVLNSIENK